MNGELEPLGAEEQRITAAAGAEFFSAALSAYEQSNGDLKSLTQRLEGADRAQGTGSVHAAAGGLDRPRARARACAAAEAHSPDYGAAAAESSCSKSIIPLSGEKEEFKPLRPNEVRMYVCGMTNYDYIHVGHARMLVAFDLVQRYLRSLGYKVTYVRNVTDIDDKIIERAAANGENWADLARRFTVAMHEDCATLGLQKPDLEPRATEFIAPIIAMIQTLIDKGFAYAADNGDVMYSVRKFPNYGQLSAQEDR